jgi:hypothetical protein
VESHANVRSTIQRQLPHVKAAGADLLPIDDRVLWRPDATQAAPGMFHNLYLRAERCFDPLDEPALLVRAVGPHETQSWKAACEWFQEQFAARVIPYLGFMHQQVQDHPSGIDEQVPLAPFHAFATVKAARPPISLVLTD